MQSSAKTSPKLYLAFALVARVLFPISASAAGPDDPDEKVMNDNYCQELRFFAIKGVSGMDAGDVSRAHDLLTLVSVDCRVAGDPAYDDTTALMDASNYASIDAVRLLVDNGAEINARDKNGWTPLRYATYRLDHLTSSVTGSEPSISEVRKKMRENLVEIIALLRSHGGILQ